MWRVASRCARLKDIRIRWGAVGLVPMAPGWPRPRRMGPYGCGTWPLAHASHYWRLMRSCSPARSAQTDNYSLRPVGRVSIGCALYWINIKETGITFPQGPAHLIGVCTDEHAQQLNVPLTTRGVESVAAALRNRDFSGYPAS